MMRALLPSLLIALAVFNWQPQQADEPDPNFSIFLPLTNRACLDQIPFQPPVDEGNEAETLKQINQQRAENGNLPALTMNQTLVQIARFHSQDMAVNEKTAHEGSKGEDPWTRYGWMCEKFIYAGEIIGWGFGGDVSQMIDWWMHSPGHHDLILTAEFTDAGAGYYRGGPWGHYWTVNFGRKDSPATPFIDALSPPPTCTTETFTSAEGGVSVTLCE